ncbi:hypothetical protein [uncultured Chryseobacterium sp.]|uniref:hypothetical protein n=1 Tax=uncultured Chryseobacterium sp. TaxID=259322 RepID=UPI0026175B91|nr:hypothetical protein [uncultured Chryseobacterium sp.]
MQPITEVLEGVPILHPTDEADETMLFTIKRQGILTDTSINPKPQKMYCNGFLMNKSFQLQQLFNYRKISFII